MVRRVHISVLLSVMAGVFSGSANVVRAGTITFADAVMAHNPISYWRLGELAGSTAVDETGLNNGTYAGPDLGQPGSVINDPDTSAYFNGGFDHVAIPHHAAYELDQGTILFNFQDQNSIHDTGLFSKDSDGFDQGGNFSIFTTADGRIEARLQDTAADHITLTDPFIQLDTWYQVALTFGPSGMHLFINGQEVDSDPYTGGLGTTSGGTGNVEPIVLGASASISDPGGVLGPLTDYFSGLIDEVVVFGEALPPQVIDELYITKVVPEPTTAAFVLLGAGALVINRRRR